MYIFVAPLEPSRNTNEELLKLILEKISTTLAYVEKIDEKINTSDMAQGRVVNETLLELFPTKFIESFEVIENKLYTDDEFTKEMVTSH